MIFWLLVAGLLLLASFFFISPFLRNEASGRDEVREANLQIFRDQQVQLENQLSERQIDNDQYQQLLAEAKQLLLSNTEHKEPQSTVVGKKQANWLLPIILLLSPVFCLGVYQQLGAAADQRIIELIQLNSESTDSEQSTELQERLYAAVEKRVEQRPDNIYYWILLAKRAIQQNNLPDAQYNYAQAIKISPDDGYLLAQYAEVLFLLADSQFTDEVLSAIDKAFAKDSSNPTVIGLKGIQAFEGQQWQLAITYWQEAYRQMDSNTATARALKSGIERAQKHLGVVGKEGVISPQVEVTVSLDKSITFNPQQTVFVALVATSGAPMPLAAKKLRAVDLPITITLSDADAVMTGHNLSSVSEVKAVARLSQTGSATPQAGDWESVVQIIQLDTVFQKLELRITQRIP